MVDYHALTADRMEPAVLPKRTLDVVLEAMTETLAPIRERADALARKPDEVRARLEEGAVRARAIAAETMAEVRGRIGVRARQNLKRASRRAAVWPVSSRVGASETRAACGASAAT